MKKVITIVSIISFVFTINLITSHAETSSAEDLCVDGTNASVSSYYSDRVASKAFDDNFDGDYKVTSWQADITTPQWIKYDFGIDNEKVINKYSIAPGYNVGAGPSNFVLQGSNDDVNWIDVDINTNVSYDAVGQAKIFTCENSTAYRYYRIYITAISYSNYVIINEIEMMEEITVNEVQELDVSSSFYEYMLGSEFSIDVDIRNAQNIYAEDFTISYDSDKFEYIGAIPVDTEAMSIYFEDTSTIGHIRYIVASNGEQYPIIGDSSIIRLTFRPRTIGSGEIKILTGLLADGEGVESVPDCYGKTIDIYSPDVNNDGFFTLGDLAIASRLLNSLSDTWGSYTPDVDLSGVVDSIDLENIVSSILNN